ncbi:Hypothetical predicted protein [Cloeon dipterum]|uniref:Uncharacterized protein n=1 Tax=Cloeon dipterum TaxID=197152 RepID=A0A8S1BV46_9INSE|nr:Hypothetical predicted protein [Cloeon dipterum]
MSSSVVPRRPFATNGGPSPPPRTHRHHSWDNHLGEKRTTVYKRVTRDGVITTHTTYDDAMHFAKNALLADLQNTVNPSNASPGYGSLNVNGVSKTLYDRHGHSTLPSQQRIIKETLTTTQAAKNNNNLSELDTLLQDLSNAHYAEGVNGGQRPPSTDSLNRPTMDSLLDELSAVPNGQKSTPRHLTTTITIQETRTREGGPVASTATRELDDLMASLSDFKINASTHQHQTVTDSPYAKPNKASSKNQLDSMLGNLQADMSRQGVNTTQKGCCNACEKPIVGQVTNRQASLSARPSRAGFRSSPPWARLGTLSTLRASTATRSWALATSSSATALPTASPTTTICSRRAAPTATVPFSTCVSQFSFEILSLSLSLSLSNWGVFEKTSGCERPRPTHVSFAEMRDRTGQNLAHGALFLRAVRQAVRRRGIPREGRQALLQGRLLRHVRAQVRRMQPGHHGELHFGAQHAVASRLLCLQGLPATFPWRIIL